MIAPTLRSNAERRRRVGNLAGPQRAAVLDLKPSLALGHIALEAMRHVEFVVAHRDEEEILPPAVAEAAVAQRRPEQLAKTLRNEIAAEAGTLEPDRVVHRQFRRRERRHG